MMEMGIGDGHIWLQIRLSFRKRIVDGHVATACKEDRSQKPRSATMKGIKNPDVDSTHSDS